MDVRLGEIFWSIRRDIKEEQYGNLSSREPWQGRVVAIGYFDEYIVLEGNPTTCKVKIGELYETKTAAQDAYIREMIAHIQDMTMELSETVIQFITYLYD